MSFKQFKQLIWPFTRRVRAHKEINRLKSRVSTAFQLLLDIDRYKLDYDDIKEIKHVEIEDAKELAVFLCHAKSDMKIKKHVYKYIAQLQKNKISTVVIVNSDSYDNFYVDNELLSLVCGLYVRPNIGFDYAGWGVMLKHLNYEKINRIYLINDSVVGPIDQIAFDGIIKTIRSSKSNLLGLTSVTYYQEHLQSYFMSFDSKAIHSQIFKKFWNHIYAFSDKQDVIDCYEEHTKYFFEQNGFSTDWIFKNSKQGENIYQHYDHFLNMGFPFIKGSVLVELEAHDPSNKLLTQLKEQELWGSN